MLTALEGLYPEAPEWPGARIDPVLRARFTALARAMAEFRPFIHPEMQGGFDRAWVAYYSSLKRPDGVQDYHHYQNFTGVRRAPDDPDRLIENRQDGRVNFMTNVAALLAFAN